MNAYVKKPGSRFPILNSGNFRKVIKAAQELVSPEMAILVKAVLAGLRAIEKWEQKNPGYLWAKPDQAKEIKELGGKAFGLVTGADIASQDAILKTLARLMGPCSTICEEKAGKKNSFGHTVLDSSNYLSVLGGNSNTVIFLDPLDGSTNYKMGGCEWTITITLVKGGVHVCGLVLNPVKGTMVFGSREKGVFAFNCGLVEQLIPTGVVVGLADQKPIPIVTFAEGYDFQISTLQKKFQRVLERIGDESKCVLKALSCANTLMDLMLGRVSLVFIPRQSPWDYSGALPLLLALGMTVVFFTQDDDGHITLHRNGFEPPFADPEKRIAGFIMGWDPVEVERFCKILEEC